MLSNEFVPVTKLHTNQIITSVRDGISPLPVTVYPGMILSVWRLPSIWERVKFLFSGEVTLTTLGERQCPVALQTGDTIRIL